MKKSLLAAVWILATAANAQTVEHLAVASQFNNWQASAQSGPYNNTNLIAGANVVSVNPCMVQGDPNHQIPVFAANTPIRVVDLGTPSLTETVTPTSIANGGCTATLTTTNAHGSNYVFKSGTFGLQEAINAYANTGGLTAVELDSVWHAAGGGYAQVYNAAGSPSVNLVDVTYAPSNSFKFVSPHYAVTYSLNTNQPTLAAGAAAGTSPTVSNTTGSIATFATANVTTGTSPTTGTLFTETYTTSGSVPNCFVQSVGTNAAPALTVSATATVLTVAVTTAPAASTAYTFNIQCN